MVTANNGILIVAMIFAFAWRVNSPALFAIAFAMAGLSYVVNVTADYGVHKLRDVTALIVIALAFVGFGIIASMLLVG